MLRKWNSYCILTLMFFSSVASAADLKYTLGLKSFVSTYYFEIEGLDDTYESDLGTLWGVTGSIRGEKWVAGLNSLTGSFNFPEFEGSFDRSEVDMYAGYYFHPQIAAILGYKYITYDWDDDTQDTYTGPAFGVSAFYPTNFYSTAVFGSISYVITSNSEVEGDDAQGPTVEVGIAGPIIPYPSWSYSVAYKFQTYNSDEIYRDVTGMTLSLNYSFGS